MDKKEHSVFKTVANLCGDKETCLVSPKELAMAIPDGVIEGDEIEKLLQNLVHDGYVELIYSDRKGNPVYCLSLTGKGKFYEHDKQNARKALFKRLLLTIGFAIVSFFVGVILRSIFK